MHRHGCVKPAAVVYESIARASSAPLPSSIDYSEKMMAIRDQGDSSACVAYAVCAMKEFQDQPGVYLDAEALFNLRHYKNIDGMALLEGVMLLKDPGAPPHPVNHRISSYFYSAPSDIARIKAQLIQYGVCVASFPCLDDPIPDERFWRSNNATNGHSVTIVGYDDKRGAFKLRNSWGVSYGSKGYAWISYDDMARYGWEVYASEDADHAPNPEKSSSVPCCF
jgi:C1A family cysteine protease